MRPSIPVECYEGDPASVVCGGGVISFLAILIVGFFLGMRHATDPDHVIAVTTIVIRQRGIANAGLIGVL